jgi:hypothetical protein
MACLLQQPLGWASKHFSTGRLQSRKSSDKVSDSLLRNEVKRSAAAAASGLPGAQIFNNQQPISVGVLVRERAEYPAVL